MPVNPDPMGTTNTPVQTGAPNLIDSSQIDRNLQYMSTVQQSWNLPTIPPNVQLDLASQSGMNTSSLGGFLQGIASDVNSALNPFAAQSASAAPLDPNAAVTNLLPQQNITQNNVSETAKTLASLEGNPAPSQYDSNAVEYYKTKAMAYGFLPPGSDSNPDSWDPSLNFSAFDQVQTRELQNRIAGQKPGSASYKQIFGAMNDFVDPSSQAGAIGNAVLHSFAFTPKDVKSFGHAWGSFFTHPSAGNLWGAVKNSAPIVVPLVTDVLLVTGAGEIIGAMRAGELATTTAVAAADAADAAAAAAKAAGAGASFAGEATAADRAATAAEMAGKASATAFGDTGTAAQRAAQFGQAAEQAKASTGVLGRLNPLGDVSQLRGAQMASKAAEPGFIAGKLAASDNTVLHGAGSAMEQWRNLRTVQVAKTATSVMTRAGVVAVAGTKIAPTSSDFYKGYRTYQKSINTSGLGTILNVAAIPLAPPSIFRPGTFMNLAQPLADGGRTFLTSNDGARTTWEVAKGLGLSTSDDLVNHFGGIADGGGDATQGFVGFIAHSAGMDKQATLAANQAATDESTLENVTKWNQTYNNVRNAHLSQLVHLHPDDTETFLHVLRQKAGDGTADVATMMLRGALDVPPTVQMEDGAKAAEFFHGTSSPLPGGQFADRYTAGAGAKNLFGPGVYVTDNPNVALSYTQKGARASEAAGTMQKTVYGMHWTGEQAPNVIDLAKPLPTEVQDAFAKSFAGVPSEGYSPADIADLKSRMASTPGDQIYKELKSTLSDASLPKYEVDEHLNELHDALQEAGYDGFKYQGGKYTSAEVKHNAYVFFGGQDGQVAAQLGKSSTTTFHPPVDMSGPARDAMNTVIDAHNANRVVASNEILKGLAPGDVTAYLRNHVNNVDDWKSFVQAHSDLQGWTVSDGLLNAPAAFSTDLKTGKAVYKDVHYLPALQPGRTAGMTAGDPGESLAQDVLQRAKDDPNAFKHTPLSPMARRVAVGDGRMGLALKDTVSKQEAQELIATIKGAQDNLSSMRFLDKNPAQHQGIKDAFDLLGQPIHEASAEDLGNALDQSGVTPQAAKAAQYLRRISSNGEFDPAAMVAKGKNTVFQGTATVKNQLQTELDALNNNAALWSRFGNVNTSLSINDKLAWLSKKQNFLAGAVEGVPADLAASVDNAGYKLVHGASFFHPQDLQDLVEPYASVSKMQAHRLSLGTYILPGQNLQVGSLIHAKTVSELVDTMHARGLLDETQAAHVLDQTGEGTADSVIRGLYSHIQEQKNAAQEAVDLSHSSRGNYFNKLMSNAQSAKVPQGLRDLTVNQIQSAMEKANLPEWSSNTMASLVKRAILKGHDVGFQYRGLSTVEDKLRAFNPLVDNLLLGGTSTGGWLRNTAKVGGKLVAAGGVGAGLAAGETAMGGDLNPNDLISSAAKGAMTGAGVYAAGHTIGKPIAKGITSLADGNFLKYSFLPDELAHLRNTFRFTMSPYFDLRRYTKGAIIAQMVADHNDAQLPINLGLKNLAKDFGADAPLAARNAYEQATGGASKLIDDDERFFSQRGVLGYSPNDQKAATFFRLQQQGKSTEDSLKMVQKIFSYGAGRTPLEQSINFAFFPFSFEKKIVLNAAKFLTDDFARTLLMHDALKTYDTLNQHYNLSKELHDHVPLLPDLEKLNAFEHGLSPGQLGGINAPIMKIAPLLNQVPLLRLFLPVGVRTPGGASKLLTGLMPAYNDIKRMSTDLEDQGHVVFGATHQTRSADINTAYSTWQHYMLTQVNPAVVAAGFKSYQQAAAQIPALKQAVDNYKGSLMQKYPEWTKSLAAGSAKTATMAADMTRDLQKTGPDFDYLRMFKNMADQTNAAMKQGGYTAQGSTPSDLLDNAASVPPDIQRAMRLYAIWLSENSDDTAGGPGNGGFAALYAKYWGKIWGPISRPA